MKDRRRKQSADSRAKDIEKVTITADTGRQWWQVPDGPWRSSPFLQRIRLRALLGTVILPLLQQLEGLYRRRESDGPAWLIGKKLKEVEADPHAIEAGIGLFDLALSTGFIAFEQGKGGADGAPVGGCGMSVGDARRFYIRRAAAIIIESAGHDGKAFEGYLDEEFLDEAANLKKLRSIARFDALSLSELQKGLRTRFFKLMDKDDDYMECLSQCNPVTFLRALRVTLGKQFAKLLEWDNEFMRTVAEGLDHNAKIVALGQDILAIEDPEALRALGKWPMREVRAKGGKKKKEKKKYITRIGEVKTAMGPDFEKLLSTGPEMIALVGKLKDNQIEKLKFYMEYLTPEVMVALSPLPFAQQMGILDGLWGHLGRGFMEVDIAKPEGTQVVVNIVDGLQDMAGRGTNPSDVKTIIEGGFFDQHMIDFLKKK